MLLDREDVQVANMLQKWCTDSLVLLLILNFFFHKVLTKYLSTLMKNLCSKDLKWFFSV